MQQYRTHGRFDIFLEFSVLGRIAQYYQERLRDSGIKVRMAFKRNHFKCRPTKLHTYIVYTCLLYSLGI